MSADDCTSHTNEAAAATVEGWPGSGDNDSEGDEADDEEEEDTFNDADIASASSND